jgi:hypothetical protein
MKNAKKQEHYIYYGVICFLFFLGKKIMHLSQNKERKRKIFRNTLASIIVATTQAKDDTNLHVEDFVLFDLYLSIYLLLSAQPADHVASSAGQLAAFHLDVHKLLFLSKTM